MPSSTRPSSIFRTLRPLAAMLCAAGFAVHAPALPFLDASNDFLPTYTGPKDADLDVLQADVVIDPRAQTVALSGTMKGPIDTRSSKLYVFGIDRGRGAVGRELVFQGAVGGEPKIGSGVLWEALVALTAEGHALYFDALNPGIVPLPNVSVSVSGNQIAATVPLALFPSQGFGLKEYTYNLWPRPVVSLANTTLADFAPDNGVAPVGIAGTRTAFGLVRSAKAASANCLAAAAAEVRIRSEGAVEVMDVSVQGLPPRTEFNVFVTQVPNAPFGLAWYQGAIETNAYGQGRQMFIGRFNEETFIVAPV